MALVCWVFAAMPAAVQAQATPTPGATMAPSLFTKEKIVARILFLPTGGAIDLSPRKSGDGATLETLHEQAATMDEQMRRGDFALLFEVMKQDSEFVEWMKENKEAVKVRVTATPFGAHVEFLTSKPPARRAVHEFLQRVHPAEPIPNDAAPKLPGRDLGHDANLKVPPK
jgi:hypothetical protein